MSGFMWGRTRVLAWAVVLSVSAFSEQQAKTQSRVPTPEQKSYAQQSREVDAKRQALRAKAKQAYDSEMARQKAGDCREANNTREFNTCYDQALGSTEGNLKVFEGAIRDLLGLHYPGETERTQGPAGPELTPEQEVAEFDHIEQLWRSYLQSATTAAFHQFGGGTGGPSFEMEMHLRLVRSHMAELNDIYYMALRL